jgi:hypothetical protein
MNSRDWANMASVYQAGAGKVSEYRAATGNISSSLDLILQAMADRCDALARERAAEEAPG